MTGPAYVGPDGRRRTPRHYQEAMAIYAGSAPARPVDIEGFEIQPETHGQRGGCLQAGSWTQSPHQGSGHAGDVEPVSGTAYFYYFAFGAGDYR